MRNHLAGPHRVQHRIDDFEGQTHLLGQCPSTERPDRKHRFQDQPFDERVTQSGFSNRLCFGRPKRVVGQQAAQDAGVNGLGFMDRGGHDGSRGYWAGDAVSSHDEDRCFDR